MTSPQPDKKITAADAARTADPLQAKAPQGFLRAMFERYREWSEPGLREARLLKTMDAYRQGLENFGKFETAEKKDPVQTAIENLQERSRNTYRSAYSEFETKINGLLNLTDLNNLAGFQNVDLTAQRAALKGLNQQERAEVSRLLSDLGESVAPHLHMIRQVRQKYEQFLELNPSEKVKEKFLKELKDNDLQITFKRSSVADVFNGAFEKAKELQSLEGAIEQAKTQGETLYKEFKLTRHRINPKTKLKVLPQEEANFVQVPKELATKLHNRLTESTRPSKIAMKKAFSELDRNPSRETLQAFKDAQATFKKDYDKVKEVFQAVASQLEGLSQNYRTNEGSEDLQKAANSFSKKCAELCAQGEVRLVETLSSSQTELEQGYETAILEVLKTHPSPTEEQLEKFLEPLNTLRDQLLTVTNQESVTEVDDEIKNAFNKDDDEVPTYLKEIRKLLAPEGESTGATS